MIFKEWSTDKIIGVGLLLALLILVIGNFLAFILTDHTQPADLAMHIITGLTGYMGRGIAEKKKEGVQNE